ncbi:hypothetical protein J4760_04245 [Salinicoccus sp. ID82-1]|uniref:hypothetical protein n=1 Tax=Salinicoccus sp. ID82-1 TaxID=2820269 RepID=UPI001F39B0F7|nr:hypothetical protein [Salinicoccus sp. ID82-1]MCG1009263.1 hypothetical protein [Salinicoccus sp. ID82-1]
MKKYIISSGLVSILLLTGCVRYSDGEPVGEAAEEIDEKSIEEAEQAQAEETKARRQAEYDEKQKKEAEKKAEEEVVYAEQTAALNDTITGDIERFDMIWDDGWRSTMENADTIDPYTAYENLDTLRNQYGSLKVSMIDYDLQFLNDEDKDAINEFISDMRLAMDYRQEAAKKGMEMFDTGNAPPSLISEIESEIEGGDGYLMDALANLAEFQVRNDLETSE